MTGPTRRRTLWASIALALPGTLFAPQSGAGAQNIHGRLDLVSQTIVVGSDPATIDVQVVSAAEDRRLEVRVHEPITDPDALAAWFADPVQEDFLSQFSIASIADEDFTSGGTATVTIPDEEVGEVIRREPGALPVVIDLTENGVIVDTVVTALVVEDPDPNVNIHFAFIADLRQPLIHHGVDDPPLDANAAIDQVETGLAAAPNRVLVQYNPETLSALAEPDVEGGAAAIDAHRDALENHQLFATPWVDIDEEALRAANESEVVLDYYARGNTVFEDLLGRPATGIARLDRSATAETLALLRSAGVTGVVVASDQIIELDVLRADLRPLQLVDSNGVPMPVINVDDEFQQRLIAADAVQRSHQIVAELLLVSEQANSTRGLVIDLNTVDRAALDVFLGVAGPIRRLRTSSVETVLGLAPARDASGAILRTELDPIPSEGIGDAVTDLRFTESILDTYAEMVAPAEAPIAPLRDLLLTVLSSDLTPEQRREYTNAVFDAVAQGTTGFEVLERSRVTLATRTAELPITLHNAQPLPVTVHLRVASEKLRFPEGEEQIVQLQPGDNPIVLEVESVSSGDARLTVFLTSPDRQLDLTSGVVDIRSTAISGLGLIVTAVAFLVLGLWWVRTIVRVRRNRLTASVAAAGRAEGADPQA